MEGRQNAVAATGSIPLDAGTTGPGAHPGTSGTAGPSGGIGVGSPGGGGR